MVSKLWVIPLEKYCRSPSMVLVWIWMKGGNDLAGGRIFTTLCLVSERLSMARARVPPKYGAMDGVSISIVSLGRLSRKSHSSFIQFRKSKTWNPILNLYGNGLGFLNLDGSSLSMSRFFLVLRSCFVSGHLAPLYGTGMFICTPSGL
ncbi:hypothetical protein V6N13_094462 [Hibiscus sabdariffa]